MIAPLPPLNIAIIGTGIAGMSAAWLLSQRHRITVYEKQKHIGGHSNTVTIPGTSGPIAVDTGFIVYNQHSYPNLTALFQHLDVPTKASDMSFAASLNGGRLEYSGTDLNGLFGQRLNLIRPRFWVMLKDVRRFYREARLLLNEASQSHQTLRDYLVTNNYSSAFVEDHLLPMGAAIWSASTREMLAFPATAFIRFFDSHGLLQIADRPSWRTVDGGSREYVRRMMGSIENNIFTGCEATSVARKNNKVLVGSRKDGIREFDQAIIATHADQALRLLTAPNTKEQTLLGAIGYSTNRTLLHRDPGLMPKRKRVWSSWNYLQADGAGPTASLCVTYWMNKLQGIPNTDPLFVTLNPTTEPDEHFLLREFTYEHPQFNGDAMLAQGDLWSLQGRDGIWFCGSYFGYGFHEDALQSGLAVAEAIGGVRRPWSVENESSRIATPTPQSIAA